jgi:hypothetical protein
MSMLVKELIEKLQTFPQHSEIEVVITGISVTVNEAEYDEDQKKVFIYRK